MTMLGRAAALAAALLLSGCAAAFGGYDVAPNGLTRDEDALRRALAVEAPAAYRETLDGKRPLPDDDLLRLLYAGTVGRYAGSHHESSRLFDLAAYLAEDRVTFSVSREALSLVTSDRALSYTPGRTERLMIPYFAALNFLEAGDLDGAAVEARRIEALLDRLADEDGDQRAAERRFLHYFAGTVFEAAGDWNAADVAYRRAGELAETLGAGADLDNGTGSGGTGDVVVLVERGFVPHRVEQSVVIVLPGEQVRMLTEGTAGEKAVAAAEAAARILLTASAAYGDRSGFYHDQGYRGAIHLEPWRDDCASRRCTEEKDDLPKPYILRVSWPVLYQEPLAPAPLRVRAGELGVDAVARFDVTRSARGDFEEARTAILARTVLRAAAKVALSTSIEESVGKRDEAAGYLAGLLTNVGTMLTERADTRSWHLLPGSVSLVRLSLPAGTHALALDVDRSANGRGRSVDLGEVEVRPGTTTFVATRLWR